MFGNGNKDLQSQIEYLQRELLRHRELIHDLQTTVYKLIRKKETEEPKTCPGPYFNAFREHIHKLEAEDAARVAALRCFSGGRWADLADKCEKLQEENEKLKEELGEAKLKNKYSVPHASRSCDPRPSYVESSLRSENQRLKESKARVIESCGRWRREAGALREQNEKLLNTVRYLDSRLDELIMAGVLDKDSR